MIVTLIAYLMQLLSTPCIHLRPLLSYTLKRVTYRMSMG